MYHSSVLGSPRNWLAIAAGSLGCVLGAALASLLGLYLGVAVLLTIYAARRRLSS